MGIPGFATWLKLRYPQAFRELQPEDHFDNIYLDLASTLHVVTRRARSRHGFHMILHRRLDELIQDLGPAKRVVIAMDGPAPLAKLLEQRRRRRKEADRSEMDDAEALASSPGRDHAAVSLDGPPSVDGPPRRRYEGTGVSPLFLTTGTLFMLEVHNSLMAYICHRLSDPRFRHLHYELSDSTVKGEGELKILRRLVRAAEEGRAGESHAIIGGDSDLLIMAMASGRPDVAVVDDRPPKPGAQARSRHRGRPRSQLFSCDALQKVWEEEGHLPRGASPEESAVLALDLALLAILSSGNDYLPACQGMTLKTTSGRPGVWNLYLDMRRQPEWQGQGLVFCTVPDPEDQPVAGPPAPTSPVAINKPMLAALLRRHHDQKFVSLPAPLHRDTAFKGAWGHGATLTGAAAAASAAAYAPPLGFTRQHLTRLPADHAAFLQGVEWVLSMYVTGSIRDYRFSYPATSPMLQSLIKFLEGTLEPEYDAPGGVPGAVPDQLAVEPAPLRYEMLQPLIPAACALALLPASNRRQAASPLRHLMDADSPIAEIYAVCKECRRLATDIRAVASELEGVRKELAALQDKLTVAALDSEGAAEAEADLTAAVDRWEAAGDRLKDLLRGLSRSQQEHLADKHPYKPFPTEELEAAVLAVPAEHYPPWERKLARFGREMLFKSAEGEEGQGGDVVRAGLVDGRGPLPGWVRDCSRFAAAYPKVADIEVVRGAALSVAREILPQHPYMQPGTQLHARPRRQGGPPAAAYFATWGGARGLHVGAGGVGPGAVRRSSMNAALVACARVLPRLKALF